MTPATKSICCHFAELFSYPTADLAATVAACSALLRKGYPESVSSLERFTGFLYAELPARVEEIYTAAFDLQPVCHPYVGYQLCGESQKRAFFLMQLQQLYRQYNFTAGEELPDHLATLLRFIASVDDRICCEEIVGDGLLPAVERMLAQTELTTNPYIQLLQALRLVLTHSATAAVPPVELRRKEVCA